MYHVALDINPEQKMQLKLQATARGQSVKEYCTEQVVQSLPKPETKDVKNKKIK